MVLFAALAHAAMPWAAGAAAGLAITAAAILISLRGAPSGREALGVLGVPPISRRTVPWATLGAILGILLAVIFRTWGLSGGGLPEAAGPAGSYLGADGSDVLFVPYSPVPAPLQWFAVVAVLIGAAEELLYRGYVQGQLAPLGWPAAVALAAAGHTLYKCGLFAFPPEGVAVNFTILAAATFLGGMAFGVLRQFSGGVIAPVLAHATFDLIVYGDHAQSPWWVWG
jgi:membrane protease YdiL (CAAX protease family)